MHRFSQEYKKLHQHTNRRYQILLEMAGSAAGKRAAIAIGKEAGKGLAIGLVFGFGYQVCSELH